MKKLLFTPLLLISSVCAAYPANKPILGRQLDRDHSLSRSLVGAWLFNDRPGVNGKVYDISGNGRNGTLVGDTHSVPGRAGNALDFDGSGDIVTIDNDIVATETDSTILVCFKSSATAGGTGDAIYCERSTDVPIYKYEISASATTHALIHRDNSGTLTAAIRSVAADGQWHIGGWTKAGRSVQFYLDGVADGAIVTLNGNDTLTVGTSAIGGDNYDTGSKFIGQIGFVYIYARSLSPSEISALAVDPFQIFERRRLPIAAAAAPPSGNGQVIMRMMSSVPGVVILAVVAGFVYSRRAQ